MKLILILGLLALTGSGCSTTGSSLNVSSAGVSGCIVAGAGHYGGSCWAQVP